MKNTKLRKITIGIISVVSLIIIGFFGSLFYIERTQEGLIKICDKLDKNIENCKNIEAKYYYDSMDGIYHLSEIDNKNTKFYFEKNSCSINAQNFNECTDSSGKTWMIIFNSYMD